MFFLDDSQKESYLAECQTSLAPPLYFCCLAASKAPLTVSAQHIVKGMQMDATKKEQAVKCLIVLLKVEEPNQRDNDTFIQVQITQYRCIDPASLR